MENQRAEILAILNEKANKSESSNQQESQVKVDDVKTKESVKSPQVEANGSDSQEAPNQENDSSSSDGADEPETLEAKEAESSSDEKKSEDAKEKNTPKQVPAAALYEERERRKELSSKLKDIELKFSEAKKVIEIAKRELKERDGKLLQAQRLIDEGKKERVIMDPHEIELKRLKMDQELKDHLEKVKKEKEVEITKQVQEEKHLEIAKQLDAVCDSLVKKYPYVEKEEILTAMAFSPKFKGQLPSTIAKTIHEDRVKKFGQRGSGTTTPNHPRTVATQTNGKSADDADDLFTPDAQGIRNYFRAKGK